MADSIRVFSSVLIGRALAQIYKAPTKFALLGSLTFGNSSCVHAWRKYTYMYALPNIVWIGFSRVSMMNKNAEVSKKFEEMIAIETIVWGNALLPLLKKKNEQRGFVELEKVFEFSMK